MVLRPYQEEAIRKLRAGYAAGVRSQVLVLPTGGGKSLTFGFMTKGAMERGLRTVIVTHRSEILRQVSSMLDDVGVPHIRLQAGMPTPAPHPVVVASVYTLARRLRNFPRPDFCVIDECHHVMAETWAGLFAWEDTWFCGVTATPERLDGQGLERYFQGMVIGPTVRELTEMGFLAPARYFSPPHLVDPAGLKTVAGDYSSADAATLMDRPSITGSAVDHYRKYLDGKPAIAFCVNLVHAGNVSLQFNASGIPSEVIDGTMDDEQRSGIIDRLGRGQTRVMVSVNLVSEGFDCPVATGAILLRPTKSMALHLQQLGRVLRPAPDKSAIVLDHVGNVVRLGLADDDREWSLEGTPQDKRQNPGAHRCKVCFALFRGPFCPQCGAEIESKPRKPLAVRDGELRELTASAGSRRHEELRCNTYEDFVLLGKKRGYHPAWAKIRFLKAMQSRRSRGIMAMSHDQEEAPPRRLL